MAEFTNAGTAYSLMVNLIGIPASGKSTAPLCKDPFFHKPLENRALPSEDKLMPKPMKNFECSILWHHQSLDGGTNTHPHFLMLAS